MRAKEFITEWRDSHLYHATTWGDALAIWRSGAFRPGTSFTRMWTYATGYAQGMQSPSNGYAVFALDADKLRREFGRSNLSGYDWFHDHNPSDAGRYQRRDWFSDTDRAEEQNRKAIPVKKFLAKLDIWMPVDHTYKPEHKNYTWIPGKKVDLNTIYDYTLTAGVQRALERPETKQIWDDMTQDPRVKVHPIGAFGGSQQGVRIDSRVQYDQNHPAYGYNE
jgi:hypothetical protein